MIICDKDNLINDDPLDLGLSDKQKRSSRPPQPQSSVRARLAGGP